MGSPDTRPLDKTLRDSPDKIRESREPTDIENDPATSRQRFRRNTYLVVALSISISLIFASWRMAAGAVLGGVLSIFNERWLWASTGVMLGVAAETRDPRLPQWTAAKFLLRYFVIGLVATLAVRSGFFSIAGICLGLVSFVGALMIEAGYQLYLTIKPKVTSDL